jgi:hypothetical protein
MTSIGAQTPSLPSLIAPSRGPTLVAAHLTLAGRRSGKGRREFFTAAMKNGLPEGQPVFPEVVTGQDRLDWGITTPIKEILS